MTATEDRFNESDSVTQSCIIRSDVRRADRVAPARARADVAGADGAKRAGASGVGPIKATLTLGL
jgi:hypothetical protein